MSAWPVAQATAFLRLAGPMVVSRAGLAGMSIADGVMVARHSPEQLALLGLAEGTLGRLLDVLVALLVGGIALAARAHAGDRPHEAGAVWRRAVVLAVVTGAAVMAIGFAGQWWLGWFGEAPALAAGAAPVVAVLGAGLPPALVAVATAVFLEAVGRAPAVAIAVAAANVLNIALNWLLIGGHAGLPALGAVGSAISTSLVRLALAVALVAYAWTLPDHARLGVRARNSVGDGVLQRRLGYGAAAAAAVLNALGMGLTVLASWLGTLPLAAITGLFNVLSVGALLALGMADATALRVAAGPATTGGRLAAGALGMAVTLLALTALVVPVLLAPAAVAGWYAPDGALHAAMTALLPLGALVLLCDGAAFVAGAGLRGLRDVVWPTGIQIGVAALLLALAWWLAVERGGGAMGIVEAILATSVLRATLLVGRFRLVARRSEA